HAQHGLRECARRARGGRERVRRLVRRTRRMSLRTPCYGEHRDGGPRLPLRRRRNSNRRRSRSAHPDGRVARGSARAPARGLRLSRRARTERLTSPLTLAVLNGLIDFLTGSDWTYLLLFGICLGDAVLPILPTET